MRTIVRLLLACAFLLVGSALPVAAQESPEKTASDVSKQIMSPFCPGSTLHDCTSGAANDLRARIEAWAARGWSEERILGALEDEYGPSIRAVPERDGAGLFAWLLPGVAVVAGVGLLVLLLRRWTRPAAAPSAPSTGVTSEERSRIEAELTSLRDATWGER